MCSISDMESKLRLKLSGVKFQRPKPVLKRRSTSPRKLKIRLRRKNHYSTTSTAPSTRTMNVKSTLSTTLSPSHFCSTKEDTPLCLESTPNIPIMAALRLEGHGCLKTHINIKQNQSFQEELETFTIEAIINISSASSVIRKHAGLEVDGHGNFRHWSCCGSTDRDPLSWCKVWDGKGIVDDGKQQVICHHNMFRLTTKSFTVFHDDGTVTKLTDFHIPVDRFVYLTATFDGCYLRVYINDELVCAKCVEYTEKETNNITKQEAYSNNSKSQVIIGEQFVGMICYVRITKCERSHEDIMKSMHPWYSKQETEIQNRASVMIPLDRDNLLEDKNVVFSISICEMSRLSGLQIATDAIFGSTARKQYATLCGSFGWCVNPSLNKGAIRVTESTQELENNHLKSLHTTIPILKHHVWKKLHILTEQLRTNGNITLTIAWDFESDSKTDASSNQLDAANNILCTFANNKSFQDWDLKFTNRKGNFVVSLSYFNIDAIQQNTELYTMHRPEMMEANEVTDVITLTTESVLHSVEAIIRSATTMTHKKTHAYLRNAFRARLWSEEFGSGHHEMSFLQIFDSLSKISGVTSMPDLMLTTFLTLQRKKTRANGSKIIQSEFSEGLFILAKLAQMPKICECAIQLANRLADRKIDTKPNTSSPRLLLGKTTTKMDSSKQKFAKLPSLELENMINLSSNDESGKNNDELISQRLVSYSVTIEWKTRTIGHSTSSLEATANLSVFCVAMNGQQMPLETVSTLNEEGFQGAVLCDQSKDTDVSTIFKEFEHEKNEWVTRSLTFDFDLNMIFSAVKTFALVLGANGSTHDNVLDSIGDVMVRIDKVTHDIHSFKDMAFEQRRKTGGTKSSMDGISNLQAKVFKKEIVGVYKGKCCAAACHSDSAMALCIFERIQEHRWGFRLINQALKKRVHNNLLENVIRTSNIIRTRIQQRKHIVHVVYCHNCEAHQKTSWHVPGQFEQVFKACSNLISKTMPSVIVTGKPVIDGKFVGAFEVFFQAFEGGAKQVLYSAMAQRGWLPTPEYVCELVIEAVKDLHWNQPDSMIAGGPESKSSTGGSKSPSSVRFSIRDAVTKITVRLAVIHLFPLNNFDDVEYASKQVKELRSNKNKNKMDDAVISIYSNARGRCETILEDNKTYFVHIEANGYYPVQMGALKWNTPIPNGKQRNTLRIINLMPLIELVNITIVDLDKPTHCIEASGIETVLVNRRTLVKHTTKSNNQGMSFLHIPHGSYRIDIEAPKFDQIPYSMVSFICGKLANMM